MAYKNLADMFFQKRNALASKTAYVTKEQGKWISVTYKEAVDEAERMAAGLASLGVEKGDKVAIISPNRMEWALADYAALALGALLVPIYPSLLADQTKYILNDSEAKVVIVSDELQMQKVVEVLGELNTVKNFYILDSDDLKLSDPWKKYQDLLDAGEKLLENKPDYVTDSIDKVKREEHATLIYTSGTTGEPKGAVLTHKNFLFNIEEATKVLEVYPDDTFLSFLPLSHIFERMAGHFLSCYHGCTVAYAESVDTVAENLLEIKPTLMVSVPRLYEKIYGRVLENVETGPPLKRKIFYWSMGVGKVYINKIMRKEPIPGTLKLKKKLADKLVFQKLIDRVGGNIRFFVSGGAPLSAEIAEFFSAAGLLVLEGYGLTETSPVISVNLLDNFKFGSVGPLLPNVEVKIDEDGEILTRGDHVMVGYFKKDDETKESIDADGWFRTGDIGLIDEDGFLKITDRKKNIIVTSGGKNIAPQPIENTLITSKYIEQVMVIGDQRRFCTAVIVPSEEALQKWADENNQNYSNFKELKELPGVHNLIRSEIDRLTTKLASYETIKNFILADEPFTIESGELTPSLKIKRRVVEQKYKQAIDQMYQ